jgi:hypothetical protein
VSRPLRGLLGGPGCRHSLLLASFLVGVVVLRWHHSGHLIYFWDQTFPLDPWRNLQSLLSVWHSEYDFGRADPTSVALLPYFLLVWGFDAITRSLSAAQTGVYALMLVSGGLGAYWLTRELIHRSGVVFEFESSAVVGMASLAAAIVYTFNPYAIFFEWRIVNSVIFLTGWLPWWLLCLTRYLDRRSIRYLAAFGILSFLMSPGLSNPAFLVVVAFLALVVALSTAHRIRWRFLIPPAAVFLFVSAFWMMPVAAQIQATEAAGTYGGVTSALEGNSANLSVSNAIRFIGVAPITEMYRGERDYSWARLYDDSTADGFTFLPLLPLALVLYEMVGLRGYRNPTARYVVLALFGFLFFAKGVHSPGGGLFSWLFEHVPAFTAYRDPFSKFGLGLLVSYALLVGFSTYAALRAARRQPRMVANGILLLVTIPTLAFGWPLVTGSVFRDRGPVRPAAYAELPQDYIRVAEILKTENSEHKRILTFPQQETPLMSSLWPSGFVGFDPLRSLTQQPLISTLADESLTRQYVDAVYASFANDVDAGLRVCQRLGIGWIVIRLDNNFAFGGRGGPSALSAFVQRLTRSQIVQIEFQGDYLSLFRIKEPAAQTSQAVPIPAPSNQKEAYPFLTGVTVDPLLGSPLAPLPRFETDVGDQRVSHHVLSNGTVLISVPGQAQGSVASSDVLLKGPLVGVTFTSSSNARIYVAFSKYGRTGFQLGGTAALVNPTSLRDDENSSPLPYTLLYDLRTLTFHPNRIDIHVTSADGRSGFAVLSAIHQYDPKVIRSLAPSGNRGVTLNSETTGKDVYDFYTPWLAHAHKYLAAEIRTKGSACFFLGGSREEDGRYVRGAVLTPAFGGSGLVDCEDGWYSTDGQRLRVYFRISGGGYNYLHLNIRPGTTSPSEASVDFRSVGPVAFVGAPDDFVRLLQSSGSAAFLDSDAWTSRIPLLQLQASDGTFSSGPVEIDHPTVVAVTERFDEGWVLEATPLDGMGSDVSLSSAQHIRVNGLTNGWILDPGWVKSNLPPSYWRATPKDGISVSLVARFTPQRYVKLGLQLSGATLALCFLASLYSWRRGHDPTAPRRVDPAWRDVDTATVLTPASAGRLADMRQRLTRQRHSRG